MTNQKPIKKVKLGSISLAVFENEIQAKHGKFKNYNFTIKKSYKDKDGNWQVAQSFQLEDMAHLRVAIRRCEEHVYNLKEGTASA